MIADWARDQGITEILHYTTSRGVLGVLASRALKSRQRLPADDYLEHVWMPVCAVRYDGPWLDYISLSISDINSALYTIASGKWHATERWWGVLAFTPDILDHDDVWFSTTNNVYPSAKRAQGLEGFQALFADEVAGRYGAISRRGAGFAANRPTDPQAEVLYPGVLPTEYLQRIYTSDLVSRRTILAYCDAVGHPEIEVVVDDAVFA